MHPMAGSLAAHMAVHIVLMNAIAPAIALAFRRQAVRLRLDRRGGVAMVAQLALIWGWHSPPVMSAAMHSGLLHLAMQASLFAVALWFWGAVVAFAGDARWRAIVILLVTGKVFCLLGILFVFAPRPLFASIGVTLEDQHLAGLLMVVACPATYVAAGVVIAARWLLSMEEPQRAEVAADAA